MFDNDFAALHPDAPAERIEDGLIVAEGESGLCRVLCFSPRHDLTLAQMEVADIERVVDVWVEETINLGARGGIASVQIFENRGEIMGCSNPHPHGQIWATRHLPNELEKETRSQTDYLLKHGRVLLLDYLAQELARGERIVFANEHFVVLMPFWAVWPFETMILPRRRIGGFDELQARREAGAGRRAVGAHAALRPAVRRVVPLFDGLPPEAGRRRRARRMADARAFLPAAPALGDGEEIHGRLRDAGLAAARPHARSGGGAAEGGGAMTAPIPGRRVMSAPGPEGAKSGAIEIAGYAIVSDDDRIAGADGLVPPSLRNEKDWNYYQSALAQLGPDRVRPSQPRTRAERKGRPASRGLERPDRPRAARRTPGGGTRRCMSWKEVAKELLPQGGRVAAPGGQGVFDLFLKIGYDAFHLSRAHGVTLPGGRAIFSACDRGLSAAAVLEKAGLRVSEKIPLDPAHGVDTTIWRAHL